MKYILGKKLHMTQFFTESGKVFPATVISATPNKVTRIKTSENDGYAAVQVGFDSQKESRLSKPVRGQTKDIGSFKTLKEFRPSEVSEKTLGDEITVEIFTVGDTVEISGVSKGKGFQGVIKRHGFKGGRRSHGQKHSEREPGSIGGGLRSRVPKGMRMGGRMGGDRVTVKNLKVLAVDPATHTLLISGAIPGRRGTLVEVKG